VRDLHQILEDRAPPVSRDLCREILTVTDRPVRVREDGDVPRAAVQLKVAAERVAPLILRTAVDVEDERIFPAGIEAVWLDDEDVDLRAGGALDPHPLDRPQVDFLYDVVVQMRERPRRRGLVAREVGDIKLGRFGDTA